MQLSLPNRPTNIIFTGVAGTGKTYHLLMLQRLYDTRVDTLLHPQQTLLDYSWCDVICAVFLLENRLMSVPEIKQHALIQDKIQATDRQENISQTLWGQLNTHAHPQSSTVNSSQRVAAYYFDKTEGSQWYLLDEVRAALEQRLAPLIEQYSHKQTSQTQTISRTSLVSFHQAYGYDEFVEGIRPRVNPHTGQMQYDIQDGAFIELCARASLDPMHRYAMLIDEINRANTAQVFGELMSVIEPTKRCGEILEMTVRLAYSGRQFTVPNNVDIYATMNTQDHALTTLDTAFRRRFEFIHCAPDYSSLPILQPSRQFYSIPKPSLLMNAPYQLIANYKSVTANIATAKRLTDYTRDSDNIDLPLLLSRVNERIDTLLGGQAQLGHAYFISIKTASQLASQLYRQIIPMLIEQLQNQHHASQVVDGLMYLLYGIPLSENGYHTKEESKIPEHLCLLQILSKSDLRQHENDKIAFNTDKTVMAGGIRLNPDFVAAAQRSSEDRLDFPSNLPTNKRSEKNDFNNRLMNPFLSELPYQYLYQNNKSR